MDDDELQNTCICNSYDGRGYSCCGFECGAHPLDGKCPGSETKGEPCEHDSRTHASVKCILCSMTDGEE